MSQYLTITERHYDILIKQAIDNLPQESGGFVGGKDLNIQAILPSFNQYLGNRTDTFGISQDDILRAHAFFKKHGLDFISVYHSHPKGVPFPSPADLATGQPYHLIIGVSDKHRPVMNAFACQGSHYRQLPIKVIPMDGVSVKNLDKTNSALEQLWKESNQIQTVIDNIRSNQKNQYPKLTPSRPDSDFSTLA